MEYLRFKTHLSVELELSFLLALEELEWEEHLFAIFIVWNIK